MNTERLRELVDGWREEAAAVDDVFGTDETPPVAIVEALDLREVAR